MGFSLKWKPCSWPWRSMSDCGWMRLVAISHELRATCRLRDATGGMWSGGTPSAPTLPPVRRPLCPSCHLGWWSGGCPFRRPHSRLTLPHHPTPRRPTRRSPTCLLRCSFSHHTLVRRGVPAVASRAGADAATVQRGVATTATRNWNERNGRRKGWEGLSLLIEPSRCTTTRPEAEARIRQWQREAEPS